MQGRKCGQLITSDEAIDKSPSQVCSNNSVRLALERPLWTPEINHMFPPRFKVTPMHLLLFTTLAAGALQARPIRRGMIPASWPIVL